MYKHGDWGMDYEIVFPCFTHITYNVCMHALYCIVFNMGFVMQCHVKECNVI